MALVTVLGKLISPFGDRPLADAPIACYLRGYTQEAALQRIPARYDTQTRADGSWELSLWPNGRGQRDSQYEIFFPDNAGIRFTVPDRPPVNGVDATVEFSELVPGNLPSPQSATLSQLVDERVAAAIAALNIPAIAQTEIANYMAARTYHPTEPIAQAAHGLFPGAIIRKTSNGYVLASSAVPETVDYLMVASVTDANNFVLAAAQGIYAIPGHGYPLDVVLFLGHNGLMTPTGPPPGDRRRLNLGYAFDANRIFYMPQGVV